MQNKDPKSYFNELILEMVKQAGSSQPKRTMARSSRATSASKSPPKVNGHSSGKVLHFYLFSAPCNIYYTKQILSHIKSFFFTETSKKRPREGVQGPKAKKQRILQVLFIICWIWTAFMQ